MNKYQQQRRNHERRGRELARRRPRGTALPLVEAQLEAEARAQAGRPARSRAQSAARSDDDTPRGAA